LHLPTMFLLHGIPSGLKLPTFWTVYDDFDIIYFVHFDWITLFIHDTNKCIFDIQSTTQSYIASTYMNNNQHDALFIFSLLSYHTSTCFGRISSPSSGVEYIYVTIGACYTSELTRPDDSQRRSITSTNCHIYIFYLLMMGCWYARNM
jgi:hypothetical protein